MGHNSDENAVRRAACERGEHCRDHSDGKCCGCETVHGIARYYDDAALRAECSRRDMGTLDDDDQRMADLKTWAECANAAKTPVERLEIIRYGLDRGYIDRRAARKLLDFAPDQPPIEFHDAPAGIAAWLPPPGAGFMQCGHALAGTCRLCTPLKALAESGPGIAAVPTPRPDNSVAHLDEDLLCDDAGRPLR